MSEEYSHFQPVMLILQRRLDCYRCGQLAIFATGQILFNSQGGSILNAVGICRDCQKALEDANKKAKET